MSKFDQSHINKTGRTYNELKKIIFSNEGAALLFKEAQKNLEGEYAIEMQPYGKKDFLLRTIFKKIYQQGYSQGFKDGFEEGGLAMEIEYLKEK